MNRRCVNGQCVNASCPTVTVLETPTRDGVVGNYFDFSAEEFSDMVGYEDWHDIDYKAEIVQSGSNSWEGRIDVFKKKNTSVGEGTKSYTAAAGDWKVNDTITLKECSNPDRHPCNDVTFGGCENEYVKSKILSKKSLQSVQLCNAECYDTFNCTNYRYNKQTKECTLLTNERGEYKPRCNIRAGPVDKTATDCFEEIEGKTCGAHLEEECEYNGEFLTSEGSIDSADTCQELCEGEADCKYWIFNRLESLCILKRDERKTCNVLGGPKEPSYDYCQNLSMP